MKRANSSERACSKRLRSIEKVLKTDPLSADFRDAETVRALLSLVPNDPQVNFEYAKIFGNRGLNFQKAIRMEPKNAEFKFGFAKHLERTQSKFKAKPLVKEALDLEPDNESYALAYVRLLGYRSTEKKTLLTRVLDSNPNSAEAYFLLGEEMAYWRDGEFEQKTEYFEKALRNPGKFKDKDLAKIHAHLGFAYEKKKKIDIAAGHYKRAHALDFRSCDLRFIRFLMNHRKGELADVVRDLKGSFTISETNFVNSFFDKYAVLTPGFRKSLKKSNPAAIVQMKRYRARERSWFLIGLFPFCDEDFPKTVTDIVLDFLYFVE